MSNSDPKDKLWWKSPETMDILKSTKEAWWNNVNEFTFNGQRFVLFCHYSNCGWPPYRMTERSVEMALADQWLFNHDNVCEVGAVTPYYWPGRVADVVDPTDEHSMVTIRKSLFDVSFTDRNVLSISTLEHVGSGEFGLEKVPGLAAEALEKVIAESRRAFITIPVGYNEELDSYVFNRKKDDVRTFYLTRGPEITDNDWVEKESLSGYELEYGPYVANSVIIIMK